MYLILRYKYKNEGSLLKKKIFFPYSSIYLTERHLKSFFFFFF